MYTNLVEEFEFETTWLTKLGIKNFPKIGKLLNIFVANHFLLTM